MMKLAATAIAVALSQGSLAFAECVVKDLAKDLPSMEAAMSSIDVRPNRSRGPSLSSSEIAAIQYHEPTTSESRNQAAVFERR